MKAGTPYLPMAAQSSLVERGSLLPAEGALLRHLRVLSSRSLALQISAGLVFDEQVRRHSRSRALYAERSGVGDVQRVVGVPKDSVPASRLTELALKRAEAKVDDPTSGMTGRGRTNTGDGWVG